MQNAAFDNHLLPSSTQVSTLQSSCLSCFHFPVTLLARLLPTKLPSAHVTFAKVGVEHKAAFTYAVSSTVRPTIARLSTSLACHEFTDSLHNEADGQEIPSTRVVVAACSHNSWQTLANTFAPNHNHSRWRNKHYGSCRVHLLRSCRIEFRC